MSQDKIRVLHFSPHQQNDGIAKYQEQYFSGMKSAGDVQNTFFDVTPVEFGGQSQEQQKATLEKLAKQLKDYDIFHIQHEFGLFFRDGFSRLMQVARQSGKKIVVSVHLSPGYAINQPKIMGLGPKSLVNFARDKYNVHRQGKWHITPFSWANLLLVHNDTTEQSLIAFGIPKSKIKKLPHPVYVFNEPAPSTLIAEKLNKKPGDTIYCTVGMLHRYKGIFDAIRALKFLPESYKLAIIGGMHPISDDVGIYNKACNLIDQLGLHDRVYITGFVVDDDEMNSFIQECDIAVFPYDGTYYAHLSSGSINLSLANHMPTIAYPTAGFNELADNAGGAIVLCDTFAYYELARELQTIDRQSQSEKSKAYATKMAWPKVAKELSNLYRSLAPDNV